MRTISAATVISGVADLTGLDAANVSGEDFKLIRRSMSRRLSTAYQFAAWPDLCRVEKRYFRDLFTPGTTLTAPTVTAASEVYFPQTNGSGYYQALRNLPLTVSTITRVSTTATVTTSANHLLLTGEQMAVSGANEAVYNVTATITVTGATTFTYTIASDPGSNATGTLRCTPTPASATGALNKTYWALAQTTYAANPVWSSTETNTKGDIRYWHGTDRYYQYYNASNTSGNQPTDATYWAVLTEFDRYIALAQTGKTDLNGATILAVHSGSPRLTTRGRELNYSLSSFGIQVHEAVNVCYVEYRQKPPQLKGDTWDSSAAYTASVSQVYYNGTAQPTPTTTDGNFYDVIVTTTAGQDPDDTAASFSIVNIPFDFQRYLEHGGAADWYASHGYHDRAAIENAKAEKFLSDESTRIFSQGGNSYKTIVRTR